MLAILAAAVSTARFAALLPISPDAKRYVRTAAPSADLEIVETKSGKTLRRLTGAQFAPYSLLFSPDGRTVAASNLRGEVCLWSADSGRLIFRAVDADAPSPTVLPLTIRFSPDGRKLAVGNFRSAPRSRTQIESAAISLWDTKSGKRRFETRMTLGGEVRDIQFAKRGRTVRVVTSSITDINVQTGRIEGPPKVILAQDLSQDGRLAFAWIPGWIHITDIEAEKVVVHVADSSDHPARRVVFAPDNATFAVFRNRLVTAGDTGYTAVTVELWRFPEGIRLWSSPEMAMAAERVCFSPDGKKILMPNGELRDVASGRIETKVADPDRTILDANGTSLSEAKLVP